MWTIVFVSWFRVVVTRLLNFCLYSDTIWLFEYSTFYEQIYYRLGTFAFNVPWEVIPQLSVSLMFELRDVNVAFWHLLRQYRLVKCFFWKARTEYHTSRFINWIAASHFYQSGLNAHMTQFLTVVCKRIPCRALYDRHVAKLWWRCRDVPRN